jgi:hypothetical protein
MTPIVKAKLDSILKYPFFSAVGQTLPSNVSKVQDWYQAVRKCSLLKWDNSQLQVRNTLQGRIEDRFPEDTVNHYFWHRLQEWNPLVRELDSILNRFVDGLRIKIPLTGENFIYVRNTVRRDLVFICLETNFQDIVKPVFFLPCLDPWYAAGHFPCGWDGDTFPAQWDGVIRGGQLLVF